MSVRKAPHSLPVGLPVRCKFWVGLAAHIGAHWVDQVDHALGGMLPRSKGSREAKYPTNCELDGILI